jgi:P-type Ca2+ transporter type 2C
VNGFHRPIPDDRRDLLGWAPDRSLSSAEAAERFARFGPNDIAERNERAWRELAGDTARDPMLWFLIATAGLYAQLGSRVEAATLLASLVPLVAMDALLHRRTRASTRGLRSRLAARATAIRDGSDREIPARELVPGDLVHLAAGESFPADGWITAGVSLQADESSLTGESQPMRKQCLATTPIPSSIALEHWGFAGTRLLTGTATLRVVQTGGETLYGEIVRSAERGAHARTPLQQAVGGLVRALLGVAVVLCAALAWVRVRQGFGWADALVSAATLAVAALPEEFPVVLVMFLGVGVYRLARRRALVRRSVSVENIGRVTCVCSDKTGTLTQGILRLAHLLPADGVSEAELRRAAALASRAETGDPIDVAILDAEPAPAPETLATYPFTEDRRRETRVVRSGDEGLLAATKGAPEVILALCRMDDSEREIWSDRVAKLAAEAHKVLACATCELGPDGWAGGEPDRNLRFAGLLAFEDPVREGVAESLLQCREAGIRVLMVTGDHPETASAIAREIGLSAGEPRCAIGADLERLLTRDRGLDGIDVIARALPGQKLALVRALQASGEIVAVTGDGVNDVPALQAADVGIAMGGRGTRSAREAAAIVLLDDDFRTIVGAIAEGRQLFRNLQNSFRYLLAIHIPLVATAALIPLAGFPLVYLPIHVVWLELIIHPSALLAFQDHAPAGPLAPLEGSPRAAFFPAREWARIALSGGLLTLLVVAGYAVGFGAASGVDHARAMVLVVLSLASAIATALLSGLRTRAARAASLGAAASAVVLVQIPALAERLHLAPLHRNDWAIAAIGALAACAPLARVFRVRPAKDPRGTPS